MPSEYLGDECYGPGSMRVPDHYIENNAEYEYLRKHLPKFETYDEIYNLTHEQLTEVGEMYEAAKHAGSLKFHDDYNEVVSQTWEKLVSKQEIEEQGSVTTPEIWQNEYIGSLWLPEITISPGLLVKNDPPKKTFPLFPPKRGINWSSGWLL